MKKFKALWLIIGASSIQFFISNVYTGFNTWFSLLTMLVSLIVLCGVPNKYLKEEVL